MKIFYRNKRKFKLHITIIMDPKPDPHGSALILARWIRISIGMLIRIRIPVGKDGTQKGKKLRNELKPIRIHNSAHIQ
jgi:hypothetical protein